MKNLEDLSGLIDELYLDELQQGNTDLGELEIYAASKLHSWNVCGDCSGQGLQSGLKIYLHSGEPLKTVHLARSGSYYAVELDGYIV
ncbi:hypothetical protein F443_02050 [Phytophthora nicotianae P1569]|uniref:Uncharacterized protein n=1 Tax=Phytophthora nicotianae P1569 TaxID=1317065 RepID=V9FUV5_PHYNI|nr:hypothetical protein F443_02050 [Phytophthora nicotianae P1569]